MIRYIVFFGIIFLLIGCGPVSQLKLKHEKDLQEKREGYKNLVKNIHDRFESMDIKTPKLYIERNEKIRSCDDNETCISNINKKFISDLEKIYFRADFDEVFALCNHNCKTPKQLESIVLMKHNISVHDDMQKELDKATNTYQRIVDNLKKIHSLELQIAEIKAQQNARAIAFGMAMQMSIQQQQQRQYQYYQPLSYAYNNSFTTTYTTPNFTYYNGGISGTSQRVGNFTYYNLNGNNFTSQQIGNTRNYSGDFSGTSTRIGNFNYHNFDGVTGTSSNIGSFKYSNFSNGTNCTTSYIGSSAYTSCY